MLKRKISFINFTVIVCGLIIAAGTICLLLMQKNLIKEDTKYLAYTELAQEVKRAKKNIGFDENENPYIKSDFYDLEEKDTYNENVYVFLQSRDGSFLDGRMPDDFRTGLDIGLQSLTKVTFQGERYYVASRRGKMKNGTEDDSFYLVCAMISERAVEQIIRILLPPTRTQPLPVRLLWRQLPATLPAMQTTSPSSTTATTCRSDTKRSIR